MVAQEGDVDWFRFALRGEEGPGKLEQRARWKKLHAAHGPAYLAKLSIAAR